MHKALIFGLGLFLWSCYREQPQVLSLRRAQACVFLHDVSQTFKQAVPPDRALLVNLAHEISKGGGLVAFGLVGSPDSTPQLIRQAFQPLPVLPMNPTYTDRASYRNASHAAMRANDSLINLFADEAMALIRRNSRGHAWTDVNKGLERADQFFSELQMEGFAKVLILNCDGNHDVVLPSGKREHTLNLGVIEDEVNVITCGWTNPQHPQHWYRVESPAGLIQQIQRLTHK